jgi:hypothetical protein
MPLSAPTIYDVLLINLLGRIANKQLYGSVMAILGDPDSDTPEVVHQSIIRQV